MPLGNVVRASKTWKTIVRKYIICSLFQHHKIYLQLEVCFKHLQLIRSSIMNSPEAGRKVDRHVLVPLLKAVVLADVMQVVTSDDNGPLHLHLHHHT